MSNFGSVTTIIPPMRLRFMAISITIRIVNCCRFTRVCVILTMHNWRLFRKVTKTTMPDGVWRIIRKQRLDIRRGDILVFHANLHHRGVHFHPSKHRRLLQIFEVFPDRSTYEQHVDKLVIVQSSDTLLMKHVITCIKCPNFPR